MVLGHGRDCGDGLPGQLLQLPGMAAWRAGVSPVRCGAAVAAAQAAAGGLLRLRLAAWTASS
jgi:hypothetical protein